jgi:hypothetical protein
MDGRAMIVGSEYDELMSVGGESGPQHPMSRHYGPGPQAAPQGYDPRYAQHYGPPQGYHPPPPHQDRHVRHEQPTRQRDFPVGFTLLAVPPGTPVEIEVKPQVLFKGKRLAIGASTAKDFIIIDIKVGKNSQLAATGEMGAEAFSSLAVGTQMELDTAQPGITITLRIRNIAGSPRDFFAVLYGAVME